MQETKVIYKVLAASFMWTLTVWALDYSGCCDKMLQYIMLWKYHVYGQMVEGGKHMGEEVCPNIGE